MPRARAQMVLGLCLSLAIVGPAPDRGDTSEQDRLVGALAVGEGMRLADVGAGNGEWTAVDETARERG